MNNNICIPFEAAADLSAKQFYGVKFDATDPSKINVGAGDSFGILQNDPKSGEAGSVCMVGESWAICSGNSTAIAAGDSLVDSSGVLVKTTTDNGAMVAVALEACTTATTKIKVFVTGPRRY